MRKLLIAARSDDLFAVLKRLFKQDFQISTCTDGNTALTLIKGMKPDVLILDLSLPEIDGLDLLRMLYPNVPPVILALTDHPHAYPTQAAIDLGVGYVMTKPFRTEAVYPHVMEMLRYADAGRPPADPQSIAAAHLAALGFSGKHAGYHQLRVGIPLFRQDPSLRMDKELYPAIAVRLAQGTPKQISRSIDTAIQAAWAQRDSAVWDRYFPGCTDCPTNKAFIARLAEFTEPPDT